MYCLMINYVVLQSREKMKNRSVSLILILAIVMIPMSISAQSPAEYVRNTLIVPNIWDTEAGWIHYVLNDQEVDGFTLQIWGNRSLGLDVVLINKKLSDGSVPDVLMAFAGDGLKKMAIKVNGVWHVAREPYNTGNGFDIIYPIDSEGREYTLIRLDTIDGIFVLKLR